MNVTIDVRHRSIPADSIEVLQAQEGTDLIVRMGGQLTIYLRYDQGKAIWHDFGKWFDLPDISGIVGPNTAERRNEEEDWQRPG